MSARTKTLEEEEEEEERNRSNATLEQNFDSNRLQQQQLQRSVTPNFSFRRFFETASGITTTNNNNNNSNSNSNFRSIFSRLFTNDQDDDSINDCDTDEDDGCAQNIKKFEQMRILFHEEKKKSLLERTAANDEDEQDEEEKKKKNFIGNDRHGENPEDYLFDDLGSGFVPPKGVKWVSSSSTAFDEANAEEGREERSKNAAIETVIARTHDNKLPGSLKILYRAPSNVIMAKDKKGRTLPVLPEKIDDASLLMNMHSRDPSEIPEDVLLALEEDDEDDSDELDTTTRRRRKSRQTNAVTKDVEDEDYDSQAPPTPSSTPVKLKSSNFRKKQDSKKVYGVNIPSTMWEFIESNRAMNRVLTMLMKELKPLGVEGMTIFDPIAGIMLYKEQRAEARLKKTSKQYLYGDDEDDGYNQSENSAEISLETMEELKPALRHASAAYGIYSALLMTSSNKEKFATMARLFEIQNEKDPDILHDKITETVAKHANVDIEDILIADWETLQFSPASYVAIDRNEKLVVLAIRGTFNGTDLVTDACSTSVPFLGGFAHSGVVMSAWQIISTRLPQMTRACYENPDFKVLLTGHSMGAAVAVCVAMLLRSGDSDVISAAKNGVEGLPNSEGAIEAVTKNCSVVSFASPAVVTLDLSLKCKEYVTSIVAGKDVIPRLCYASIRRLLRRLNSASPAQPMLKSIGGAFREVANGLQNTTSRSTSISESELEQNLDDYASKSAPGNNSSSNHNDNNNRNKNISGNSLGDGGAEKNASYLDRNNIDEDFDEDANAGDVEKKDQTENWHDLGDQCGLELRDHSGSDFLVQPGRVIHLRRLSSQRPVAQSKHPTAFTDIPLSTRMMTDHIPMVYESAILLICERMKQERIEKMQEVANRFTSAISPKSSSAKTTTSLAQSQPVVLSPEFKRSVAEGLKNKKKMNEQFTNSSPAATVATTTTTTSSSLSRENSATTTSEAKGWQVVRNFFNMAWLDDDDEGERNRLDGDHFFSDNEFALASNVNEINNNKKDERDDDSSLATTTTPIAAAPKQIGHSHRVEAITPEQPLYY
jgi:hypothetical protein